MNRKLRIIQSVLAIGIADLLSQSAWNPAMVESAPPSYKHKYVTGTGNATLDTGAVQRAINALGSNGGIITTYGSLTLNGSSITWPPLNQMLRFEILGQWTLNSTLTLHTAVHLVGLGGYYPTQFQVHGPVAGILPPSGNTPTIKVPYGSENTFIENIVINNCSGVGIWMQDCSLVTLKNVGVLEEDVSTAIGVQVDGTFWVWIKDCAFNAKATSGPTIRMTALTPGSTGTGLVDIRDTIIAGHGMKIDPRVSTPQPAGNVTMTNVTTESMRDAFLTIDASHAYISGIHLTKIEVADNISMPALISIINADPGKVRNVSLKDSDSIFPYVPLVTGGSISGFNVEAGSTIDYPDKGWRIGAGQRRYALMRDGTIDAETPLVFSQMSPFIIPYQTFAFGQNPAGWTKGNATVTTGVMGPDGTLTAGTLTSSGGEKYIRFNSGAVTYAVGDWVLAGVWIRGESSTKPPYAYSSISLSGSGTARFDNTTAQGFNIPGYAGYGDLNFPTQQLPSAWYPAIGYGKITSITGSTSFETVLDLKCTDTQPTSYWKQWAMRIPAGTMPDQEVIRLARSLRNMLPNVPAGSLGMYPDQTFYAGRIVSQRTTTFADADAAPSVSGGNLFKTANTGATTITQFDDGVDGQVIRILIDANTTIQNNANIKNRSGANVTGAANITESYVRISGAWYQLN